MYIKLLRYYIKQGGGVEKRATIIMAEFHIKLPIRDRKRLIICVGVLLVHAQ